MMWQKLPDRVSLTYLVDPEGRGGCPALTFIYHREEHQGPNADVWNALSSVFLDASTNALRVSLAGPENLDHKQVYLWRLIHKTSPQALASFTQAVRETDIFLWITSTPQMQLKAWVNARTHLIVGRQAEHRDLH